MLKKWKLAIFFGLAILIVGFLLRIYNLTHLPVFVDEAIYIRWSQIMNAEATLRFLPLSDGKQPLFMWILMFLVNKFNDPLLIARLISVFTGMGTIVGIFFASFLIFKSKKVSLLASFLWAVSPFSLFFDRLALVDSMLTMFGIWTFILGVILVKIKRLDVAMISGMLLGFALLTKSPALFFALLLPTLILLIKIPRQNRLLFLIKIGSLFVVTYVIGYGMYNVLRLGPNFHLIAQRNQDYIYPLKHILESPTDPLKFHIEQFFGDWFVKIGPWPVLVLFISGIVVNFKKNARELLILLVWFFVPILAAAVYVKASNARYILYTVPFMFIIASSSLLVKKVLFRNIMTLFITLFAIFSLHQDYLILTNISAANLPQSERSGYLEEWTAGDGIKEAAEIIKAEYLKNQSQKIVVGTEGYFGTLPDGLQMYLNKYPQITVIGIGLGINKIPSSLLESKNAGNKTYLVINKSRLEIKDPEKSGLRLIKEYPKAERREKLTRDYVKYGPQEVLYLFEVER